LEIKFHISAYVINWTACILAVHLTMGNYPSGCINLMILSISALKISQTTPYFIFSPSMVHSVS
jgi:hypothetical protein